MQDFYTASQIGKLCGLHKVTILKHLEKGKIANIKLDDATKTYRWQRSDVAAYLFEEHGTHLDEIEREGGSDE